LAEKEEKMSQRVQALEETRHQEIRKDTATFAKWQIWLMLLIAIISAVAAIVVAVS